MIVPSELPLAVGSVCVSVTESGAAGSSTVKSRTTLQPFSSTTVTEYLPAARLLISFVDGPWLQVKEGFLPPVTVNEIEPVLSDLQRTCTNAGFIVNDSISLMVSLVPAVQSLASFTLMEYFPGVNPENDGFGWKVFPSSMLKE